MDTTTLVAISALVLANIGTTIGLFTWATNHAASDNRELRRVSEKMHSDILRTCESIQSETRQFHEEMKIIHGRICTVEERIKPKPMIQK